MFTWVSHPRRPQWLTAEKVFHSCKATQSLGRVFLQQICVVP